MSPSSRRAWIEISAACTAAFAAAVALLAEGVDRNLYGFLARFEKMLSPSSRRAWIEIGVSPLEYVSGYVALLAEGVDRNIDLKLAFQNVQRRPPRGGRG